MKAMIGDTCQGEGQAKPLSYLSLSWGMGTIVGPGMILLVNHASKSATSIFAFDVL